MVDNKKVINGKARTVHTGKKGGKYYVSKGKKVYFGGAVFSSCKKPPCNKKSKKKPRDTKSKGKPRRMVRSLSSSSNSPKSKKTSKRETYFPDDTWGEIKSFLLPPPPQLSSDSSLSGRSPKKPIIAQPSFYINMMYNSKGKPIPIPSDISSKELKRAISEGRLFVSNVGLSPKSSNKTSYKKPTKKSIPDYFLKKVGNKYVWSSINQYAANRPDMKGMIPQSYRVPSTDQRGFPSLLYKVNYNPINETYDCSCPSYYFKNGKKSGKIAMLPMNRGCKHIRSINDGTQRKYPGDDLTIDMRKQILREQIAAGERHPGTEEFLDEGRMENFLTRRDPPYGRDPWNWNSGFNRLEQEDSLTRFKNARRRGPPFGRPAWRRGEIGLEDKFSEMQLNLFGKKKAKQTRK